MLRVDIYPLYYYNHSTMQHFIQSRVSSVFIALFVSSSAFALDVYRGTKFQYFDQEMRVTIVSSYCKALEEKYVGWELKKERLGIDPQKICRDAVQFEKNLVDIQLGDSLQEAWANLDFYDRTRELNAKFQDSHLTFRSAFYYQMMHLTLPFEFQEYEGKIIVTKVNDKILSYLSKTKTKPELMIDGASPVFQGDELIAVDDKPVAAYIQKLLKMSADSSPKSNRESAISRIYDRTSQFPKSGTVKLKFKQKNSDTINTFYIPIGYTGKGIREQKEIAYHYEWVNLDAVVKEFRSGTKKWVSMYAEPVPASELKQLEKFYDSEDNLIVTNGQWTRQGKTYEYIKLSTFLIEGDLKTDSNPSLKKSFFTVLKEIVERVKNEGSFIILDLKNNNGGYPGHVYELLTLLQSKSDHLDSLNRVYRINESLRMLFENDPAAITNYLSGENLVNDVEVSYEDFKASLQRKEKYFTVSANFTRSNSSYPTYELPLVAWISSDCVSACETLSHQLKKRPNTALLGRETAGTGMGLLDSKTMSTSFKDSYGIMTATIPNNYFGDLLISDPKKPYLSSLENIPVCPHFDFSADPSRGEAYAESQWLQKSVEVFEEMAH